MDEPALQQLIDDVPRARVHPTRRYAGSGGFPSPTSVSPRSTTTAPCASVCRAVYGPGKTVEQCAASSPSCSPSPGDRCCSPEPTPTRWRGGGRRRRRPPARRRHRHRSPRHRGVAPGRRPARSVLVSPPAPRICPSPTSAGRARPHSGLAPTLLADCGVAGVHRLLASVDELVGRRRRRGRGRHGRRAGQPGRRHHAGTGRGRPHQRRLRRRPRGRDRTSGHARVVRRGHHRRRDRQRLRRRLRRRPACCCERRHGRPRPRNAGRPSPGSTASPASPATWPSGACSTPAPTSTRSLALLGRLPFAGWDARRGARAAGRHRVHPGRGHQATTTSSSGPTPISSGCVEEARLPERVAPAGPGRLRRAGRGRGPPAPPPARAGPLPRGRRPRHHRRRRRHRGRSGGPRHRRP